MEQSLASTASSYNIYFIFFAKMKKTYGAKNDGESNELRWFSADELDEEEMFDNVRILSKEAINELS